MLGRIYLITNLINGKKYVGQTVKTIEKRLKEHFKAAFVEHRKSIIYDAIRKYGIKNFEIKCIQDNITIEDLDIAEQYWIQQYNSFGVFGYNATTGGNQCRISNETKQKISEALKGVPKSDNHKKKMSETQKGKIGKLNSFYGKTHSKETIEKIKETLAGQMDGENNPFYGKQHSDESKQKMSASHIGKQTGEKHPRSKLTEKDVLEIRIAAQNDISRIVLAKQYGVGKTAIDKIVNRHTWRHI